MPPNTNELLKLASSGDATAVNTLLSCHRARLRRLIDVWLDPRVRRRVDPSDVVQDALVEAQRQLPDYLQRRPLPFYPWLRQFAVHQLQKTHRRHLRTQRRSVKCEEPWGLALSEEAGYELADQLNASGNSPSRQLARYDLRLRVRASLEELGERDREVLVLRYLEQLSIREIAAVAGASEAAVKMRHIRALERLRRLLEKSSSEEPDL